MTRALPVVALLACLLVPASATAVAPPKDRYIVVLKDSADSAAVAKEHGRKYGVKDRLVYGTALEGYAGQVPSGKLAKIESDPRVKYVEPDGIVQKVATQSNATWGLDRIDQRTGLDKTYTYNADGTGVTAYVIDTGIRITHSEFTNNRASHGAEFVDDSTTADDCDGHGTHVAGTIGGTTYGVAKDVKLVAVRVLDCNGSGYWSWVIGGINWVTEQHLARASVSPASSVANMSLGGGGNTSVDDAVATSIAAGVTHVVAAGNDGRNACSFSPARAPDALTMGASNSSDSKPRWSNHGDCVDWFAPGVSITSAYFTGGSATWSGTSMASPHTAGAAALYLEGNPGAFPATVRSALWNALTYGVVQESKTTNNHLLFVGSFGSGTSDTTPPAAPKELGATPGDAQVSLDWADNSEIDRAGYNVYRSESSGTGYVPLNGSLVTNSAYLDTTAANGKTYYYVVTAVDTSNNESAYSNEASATPQASSTTPTTGISLDTFGYKVKGLQKADLTWSGSSASSFTIYRNGSAVGTDSASPYTDHINKNGNGTYTYQVCETGTSTCSNESTVVFN